MEGGEAGHCEFFHNINARQALYNDLRRLPSECQGFFRAGFGQDPANSSGRQFAYFQAPHVTRFSRERNGDFDKNSAETANLTDYSYRV